MDNDKQFARAKNSAFRLLRARPRSERELSERLSQKGYDEGLIASVVEDLKKRLLLDDRKFARFWVDSRMHMNPVGDVVLRHELKEKGVRDEFVEEALAQRESGRDELATARAMAVERFARLKKVDRRKATKRLYDFLMRRGFKYDVVRAVIEEVIA